MQSRVESNPMPASEGHPSNKVITPFVCTIGAAIGIFGGLAALLIGLVFVAISAISGDRSFDRPGTILLIAALPAILIGATFVDGISGQSRER